MDKAKLTPEGELMYRIIEQWDNAVAMPQMEGWIKEYGDNRVKAAVLPADDAIQNWFEENIDKECSASSAIYKFRLWLESLQATRQTCAGWVKAKDRLPGYETPVKWRDGKDHSHVTDGKIPLIRMAKPFLTGWEWLDELGTPAAKEEGKLTQSRADLIREANNRDLDGAAAAREEDANRCSVFVPCAEDDPDCCGGYTSSDGQSLCYVKEVLVPLSAFKQHP